ncbi:GTPase-activating protein skywalker isoform X5 [Leguminivora glycinivorella]|uniref:GTPase-activating protein skywalker isoform X5 n=1 Tax=Leguminivora glycinivorella TaxID=1035111 RepID=UPI00200CD4F7|nr:GTPase-activating protein skywalker isoform X5 [Leguminivora glycinivorella]
MPAMLSAVLEEEADMYEAFPPHVDPTGITILTDSPPGKKAPLKTYEELQPLLQQSRKRELKLVIRENSWPINSPVRALLWPALCRQHQHGKSMLDGFYWDMVTQVFGTVELPDKPIMLPPFVEATHCLGYHLTRKGRAVADRVVSVLGYACPDITYSPSLYPITAALLHFMPEEECYHCMASLVASKEKMFITQTKLLNEVTWKTVMQIAKKHAKSAAQHLSRLSGAIGPERIYTDWQWWILAALPFPHLVRVLDCFFHEGIKVFYRVALAILILFHKHSTNQSSDWYAEATKNGVDHAIDKFCRNMPASPTKLLRTAFSIRALSSQYISRVFIKTEMTLKSKQVITGSRLVRSRSSDNLPTSQSQGSHSPGPRALSMGVYPIQALKSQISDQTELFTLWSWLPVRITMYQPVLLYTTEEHGCSLTTFYVRVEHHEPTLLMIKTCNNEVFGAYCSTRWFERNQKDERGNRQAYFGTGETFLFSLHPVRAKYPWVGTLEDKAEDEGKSHHALTLFMAGDSTMITVGGGDGQAIWMDENIRFGKTDRCSTFNNPPLCPSGDFEIRVLEVYGFSGA